MKHTVFIFMVKADSSMLLQTVHVYISDCTVL